MSLTTRISDLATRVGLEIKNLKVTVNNKEPIIVTKLSAFNKNFGTTADTVTQGNDSRVNNGQTAFTWGNHMGLYSPTSHSHTFSSITGKPTTVEGYGITDALRIDNGGSYNNSSTSSPGSLVNKAWFDYNWAGSGYLGSVISFSGVNNNYQTEIFGQYNSSGNYLGFRTRQGDLNTWNDIRKIWHDGNFNPGNYLPLNGNANTASSILNYNNPTINSTPDTIVYRNAFGDISAREFIHTAASSHSSKPDYVMGIFPTSNQIVKFNKAAIRSFIDLDTNEETQFIGSQRDFTLGTLIKTSMDYSQINGDPFLLEIKGNSYGAGVPFDLKLQGYIYNDSVVSTSATTVSDFSNITILNLSGKLCFWYQRMSYWQGFDVRFTNSFGGIKKNLVTSIEDSADPVGTKRVTVTPVKIWNAQNLTSVTQLGYTGALNANYITNNNQLTNGAGYTTNIGNVVGTVSDGESVSTIVKRTIDGYINSTYFNGTGTFSLTGANSGMALFTGTNGSDTYGRSYTATAVRTLLNIANGANNYVHPTNHPASIITQDASNRFVSDTEKATWNAKQSSLNGTGFVKISGTTISYDNTSYLPITGGILTGGLGIGSSGGGSIDFKDGATFGALISPNASIFGTGSKVDLNIWVRGPSPFSVYTNGVRRMFIPGNGSNTIFSTYVTAPIFNGDLSGHASSSAYSFQSGYSRYLEHEDDLRDLSDRNPNWKAFSTTFDFIGSGIVSGATGNYCGVMTFVPYNGATASTGDSSYQLAYINETGINGVGEPGLRLRKGIDTTWGTWRAILTSGNVGTYALPIIGGTVTGNIYAPDFIGTSDIRLKENISILKPKPIGSTYKTYNFISDGKKQSRVGVIAQELELTNPEFVRTDSEGMKSISYQDLHSAEIAYLKNRVIELEQLIQQR